MERHGQELRGAHPLHGSESKDNFSINLGQNCWHCWRHETGGGPLEFLAMQMGLLDCGEVRPGCLKDVFPKVVREASKERILPARGQQMTSEEQDNGARQEKPRKARKKGRNDEDEAPQKDQYQLEIEAELKALERHRPRALEILERGDPLGFLPDTFSQIHVGDRDAAEVQFIAFGCQASCNSHGIQARLDRPIRQRKERRS